MVQFAAVVCPVIKELSLGRFESCSVRSDLLFSLLSILSVTV